jgi:tyrosinase
MRINGAAIICLLASSLVHAFPAPREKPALSSDFDEATVTLPSVASAETEVALDQLAELAKFASDVSQNALTSTSKQKRGPCTLSKLSIRREWSVISVFFSY